MSYFRKDIDAIEGYTPGFQPKEAGWVKLNTNESPYPPSPRAIKAMRAAVGDGLRKYPPPMADAFRTAAARVLGTSPDRILCGSGSSGWPVLVALPPVPGAVGPKSLRS